MQIVGDKLLSCYTGCESVPAAKAMSDAIDGDDRVAWHLPLPPLTSSSLEPHSPGDHLAAYLCAFTAGIVVSSAPNHIPFTQHPQWTN